MASARISSAAATILLMLAPVPVASQPTAAGKAETAFQPRRVATDLARMLERLFLYPATGKRYAAALRRNAALGRYDAIADRAAFAARLTADLQEIEPEGHLRVISGNARGSQFRASRPPALEAPGWIAPGIAYLRLNDMLGTRETLLELERFMESHRDARSFILDLRDNSGGAMAEMDIILPWLYREPARLMRMDSRAGVGPNRVGDIPSMRAEPAPPNILRFDHWVEPRYPPSPIADASVYVLTSSATVSAAEHMALALQHTRRALLIGGTTSGAGHYGPIVPLAGHFAAFIPVGRSYIAESGLGWEGSGITPDIVVPPAQALARALALSGLSEAEAEQLSARVAFGAAPR